MMANPNFTFPALIREAAVKSIRAIRAINPDYSLLPELEQRLDEL